MAGQTLFPIFRHRVQRPTCMFCPPNYPLVAILVVLKVIDRRDGTWIVNLG